MTFERKTEIVKKYEEWLEDLYAVQKIKVKDDAMCFITWLDEESLLAEE